MEEKMGITPASEIHLLKVPELDPSYENTYLFEFQGSQLKFFQSREQEVLRNYTYIRKESKIRINKHIDEIHSINYIMYKNKHNKWYYAFIMDKIYINEQVTELVIMIDLIQTYMFNYTLEESYVERAHVRRWTPQGEPTREYTPEGLEVGEYMQVDTKELWPYRNSYVAVCSNPLGEMMNRKLEQGGGTPSGNWVEGQPGKDGYRFIKGYEGFASKPYDDGLGYMTIGYGTTQKYNPQEYNQLLNGGRGCTEEEAARVFYDKLVKSYAKPIVNRLKELGITKQYQADALFSVAYNCGINDILKDTDLMKAIKRNINDKTYICNVWHTFRITPGQITEDGLRARRKDECTMFFGGKVTPRAIMKIGGGTVTENGGNGWLPN